MRYVRFEIGTCDDRDELGMRLQSKITCNLMTYSSVRSMLSFTIVRSTISSFGFLRFYSSFVSLSKSFSLVKSTGALSVVGMNGLPFESMIDLDSNQYFSRR